MRNPENNHIFRKIIHSKIVLVFLGILVVAFAWNIFGFWKKMRETEKNRQIAEDRLTSLQEQKEKLSADISSLQTMEGQEKIFRENFGLAKTGEGMIVIVEDENTAEPTEAKESGFFTFFKNLFK